MYRVFFRLLVTRYLPAFVLSFQMGCIHTRNSQHLSIETKLRSSAFVDADLGSHPLKIKYHIYQPEEQPLEAFFDRLFQGEFNRALQEFRLSYQPTTADSQALRRLMEEGYRPVLVHIRNDSDNSIRVIHSQFRLTDGDDSIEPLKPENLPTELRNFHTEAALANVYNTTVVVLAVAVVLVAASASTFNGNLYFPGSGSSRSVGSSDYPSSNNTVWNDITYRERIHYGNLVIAERDLHSGEEMQGLVFFSAKNLGRNLKLLKQIQGP